jgi:hypothetical protein
MVSQAKARAMSISGAVHQLSSRAVACERAQSRLKQGVERVEWEVLCKSGGAVDVVARLVDTDQPLLRRKQLTALAAGQPVLLSGSPELFLRCCVMLLRLFAVGAACSFAIRFCMELLSVVFRGRPVTFALFSNVLGFAIIMALFSLRGVPPMLRPSQSFGGSGSGTRGGGGGGGGGGEAGGDDARAAFRSNGYDHRNSNGHSAAAAREDERRGVGAEHDGAPVDADAWLRRRRRDVEHGRSNSIDNSDLPHSSPSSMQQQRYFVVAEDMSSAVRTAGDVGTADDDDQRDGAASASASAPATPLHRSPAASASETEDGALPLATGVLRRRPRG